MNLISFTRAALLVLLLFAITGSAAVKSAVGAEASRPDMVIFLSDDHTWRDSSVYGSPDIKTPNMQRLANAGMTFDNAFVASPSCAPSRAALLTGMYPARNGAEPNHSRPHADLKKLPAYLQELGYEVASFDLASTRYGEASLPPSRKNTSESDYAFEHLNIFKRAARILEPPLEQRDGSTAIDNMETTSRIWESSGGVHQMTRAVQNVYPGYVQMSGTSRQRPVGQVTEVLRRKRKEEEEKNSSNSPGRNLISL